MQVPLLLPHEMLAAIVAAGPDAVARHLGHSPVEFWRRTRKEFPTHPVFGPTVDVQTAWPLGIHGDTAVFSKTRYDGLECLIWSSVMSPLADPLDSRFLMATFPTALCVDNTVMQLCEVLAWSLAAAADGRWPTCDHSGVPWDRSSQTDRRKQRLHQAGKPLGCTGWVVDYRGDMSWHVEHWQLPSWSCVPHICGWCMAETEGPNCWANFWTPMADRDTETYKREQLSNETVNPFMWLPGWCLSQVRVDPMHVLLMGLCRWSLASGLLDLMGFQVFDAYGKNNPSRFRCAYKSFLEFCAASGWRANVDVFTPSRFGAGRTTEFPEAAYKAYNCRVLIAWMARETETVAAAAAAPGNGDDLPVLALHFAALHGLFKQMEKVKKRHFSRAEADSFINSGTQTNLPFVNRYAVQNTYWAHNRHMSAPKCLPLCHVNTRHEYGMIHQCRLVCNTYIPSKNMYACANAWKTLTWCTYSCM